VGEERTRLPGEGLLSLALFVLAGAWTKARGFLARVISGSAAIAATEAAERHYLGATGGLANGDCGVVSDGSRKGETACGLVHDSPTAPPLQNLHFCKVPPGLKPSKRLINVRAHSSGDAGLPDGIFSLSRDGIGESRRYRLLFVVRHGAHFAPAASGQKGARIHL
jgi:hypothetical protein